MSVVELKKRINNSTGEIISEQKKFLPNYFNPDNGYRLFARSNAFRVLPGVNFPDNISRIDMGHLLFLTRSMLPNTGCLGLVKNRKFKPFDDYELYKHIGFNNDRKGKEWLKRMVKLSMLRSIDVNLPDDTQERQWYVNPVYFCPMFISRQSYLIWRDQIDAFIPQYVKELFL